ncbi:ExeA family protein [Pseudoruegeria sp. HB172150]|uniref:ExeA family protein n=1 Tax=Pseudoruegeria sp. HB172150 TaxID=2721164 RepID=UPI0015560EF3|nr:AAA family ATPase [Pseudoruegeria sp. HB172150]
MAPSSLYVDFFGFTERPFTLVPDPGFLYWSPQHRHAYSILEFGILSSAPITLVTGEIGAGKTTLVQALLAGISDDITIGLISNAQGGRGELLQWILNALGVPFDAGAGYVATFQVLQDFLLAEYAAGRRVILIIDEAQNLSREGLEELRMLTNVNSNKDVLIQLILVGQPELRDIVRAPDMRQLTQRIAASFHLDAMDADTVADYIRHRLRTAGGDGGAFSDGACARIHRATGGVPRLVNQLCEFALLYAWGAGQHRVDEETVAQVLDDGVFFGAAEEPPEPDTVSDPDPEPEQALEPLILFRKNGGQDG